MMADKTASSQAGDADPQLGRSPPPSSPAAEAIRLPTKIAACLVSLALACSFALGTWFVASFERNRECMVCAETDGQFSVIAPFVWWSTWALITTTITWSVWVRRRLFKRAPPAECLFLLELSLPFSVFVMIGYTSYIAMSGWGADLVDEEACWRLETASIPREGTSLAKRDAYLGLSLLTNICMHYLCPVINFVLYCKCHRRGLQWRPLLPVAFVACLSLVVILAQEVGNAVIYCTDNIYLTAGSVMMTFVVLHAIFFLRRGVRDGGGDAKEDSKGADEELAETQQSTGSDFDVSDEDFAAPRGSGAKLDKSEVTAGLSCLDSEC